jgi:hypothetical protein
MWGVTGDWARRLDREWEGFYISYHDATDIKAMG